MGDVVTAKEQTQTVTSDPFHDVDVLGQHDDRLEISRHQGCVDEGAA